MAYRNSIYACFINFIKVAFFCLNIVSFAFMPCIVLAQSASWAVTGTLRSGLSSIYSASKTILLNGQSVLVTSSATLTPIALDVGKMVLRNAGAVAVVYAVGQLAGAGVEWIHDAQNKRFVYTPQDTNHESYQYYYYNHELTTHGINGQVWSTSEAQGKLTTFLNNAFGSGNTYIVGCFVDSLDFNLKCTWDFTGTSPADRTTVFGRISNSNYNPNSTPPVPISISYNQVADKIIDNANAGNLDAKNYIYSVADSALEANLVNQVIPYTQVQTQFDRNIAYPTSQAGTVTTSASGTITSTNASGVQASATTSSNSASDFQLPAFCVYAPMVCDFINWFKEPADEPIDTNIDVSSSELTINDTQIFNFSGSCPPHVPIEFSLFGNSKTFYFEYQPFCDFLTAIRPFLIASSYFAGAYIILGLSKSRGD